MGEDRRGRDQVEGVVFCEPERRLEVVHVELDSGHVLPRPGDLSAVHVGADESQILDPAEEPDVLGGAAAEVQHRPCLPEVESGPLDGVEDRQHAEIPAREVCVAGRRRLDVLLAQDPRLGDQLRRGRGAGIDRCEPRPEATAQVAVEAASTETVLGGGSPALGKLEHQALPDDGERGRTAAHRTGP